LVALFVTATVAFLLPSVLPPPPSTHLVVLAAHDLPQGTLLEADDLTTHTVPATVVPDDAISDLDAVIGTVLPRDLLAGDLVTARHLADDGAVDLSGRVVLEIPVDPGLRERLHEGDRLLLTVQVAGGSGQRMIQAPVVTDPGALDTGSMPSLLVAVPLEDTADVARARNEGWIVVGIIG
jgi:hypothetical protein